MTSSYELPPQPPTSPLLFSQTYGDDKEDEKKKITAEEEEDGEVVHIPMVRRKEKPLIMSKELMIHAKELPLPSVGYEFHPGIECNRCHTINDLDGGRYTCMACKTDDESFDLCGRCHAHRFDKQLHDPTHAMVMFKKIDPPPPSPSKSSDDKDKSKKEETPIHVKAFNEREIEEYREYAELADKREEYAQEMFRCAFNKFHDNADRLKKNGKWEDGCVGYILRIPTSWRSGVKDGKVVNVPIKWSIVFKSDKTKLVTQSEAEQLRNQYEFEANALDAKLCFQEASELRLLRDDLLPAIDVQQAMSMKESPMKTEKLSKLPAELRQLTNDELKTRIDELIQLWYKIVFKMPTKITSAQAKYQDMMALIDVHSKSLPRKRAVPVSPPSTSTTASTVATTSTSTSSSSSSAPSDKKDSDDSDDSDDDDDDSDKQEVEVDQENDDDAEGDEKDDDTLAELVADDKLKDTIATERAEAEAELNRLTGNKMKTNKAGQELTEAEIMESILESAKDQSACKNFKKRLEDYFPELNDPVIDAEFKALEAKITKETEDDDCDVQFLADNKLDYQALGLMSEARAQARAILSGKKAKDGRIARRAARGLPPSRADTVKPTQIAEVHHHRTHGVPVRSNGVNVRKRRAAFIDAATTAAATSPDTAFNSTTDVAVVKSRKLKAGEDSTTPRSVSASPTKKPIRGDDDGKATAAAINDDEIVVIDD